MYKTIKVVVFSITALLKFNSHTIQFTHLKCTIQWFYVYSQNCVTITTINSGTFSSPPKETPYLLEVTSHFSLPYRPWQPLIYSVSRDLPSLKISYRWNHTCFFVTGFFQLACFQGSSTLYHAAVLHSLLWPNNIPLCG